jgi:hypothetical protein
LLVQSARRKKALQTSKTCENGMFPALYWITLADRKHTPNCKKSLNRKSPPVTGKPA